MSMTLEAAVALTGQDFLDHLDRQAHVPLVTRVACQGDVSILRQAGVKAATTAIPAAGVVVASGREGHNHTLFGGGFFDRRESGVVVGTLTVPEGVTVLLSHEEHGALQVAAGTYRVGRQREQAAEIALVAD
jgi:hypothetical protein